MERRETSRTQGWVQSQSIYLDGTVIDASVPHSPIQMDCNHHNCTPSRVRIALPLHLERRLNHHTHPSLPPVPIDGWGLL